MSFENKFKMEAIMMKKLYLAAVFALVLCMAALPALAATVVWYGFDNITFGTNNLPTGWGVRAGTFTTTLETGGYGLADGEKYLLFSNNTTTGSWGVPPVFPAIAQISDKIPAYNTAGDVHLTATVAAKDSKFYQLGLHAQKYDVQYTTDGTTYTTTANVNIPSALTILAFEWQDSKVVLKSFGDVVSPADFNFEYNRFYRLDCIVKGITNMMDVYLDGELLGEVDISKGAKEYLDKNSITYTDARLLNFRAAGIVNHKPKSTTASVSSALYNVGYTVYGSADTTRPIVPVASDISVSGFKFDGNAIHLGNNSDITVAQLKNRITSSNTISVIDSNGAVKPDSAFLVSGDRVAEKATRTDDDVYFYYYNVTVTEPTNLFTLDFEDYVSTEDGLTTPFMPDVEADKPFNLWGSNAFYQYAETSKFGKDADDKVYRVYNVNLNVNKDGKSTARHTRILPSTTQRNIAANTTYHVSAEIAAADLGFGTLGITTRYNDSFSPDNNSKCAFAFAKNADGKIVMKSFDKVISDENFNFETGRFYKIDLVYVADSAKNLTMDIYVNGKYISTTDFNDESVKAVTGVPTKLKYLFLMASCNGLTNTSNEYFDNITMDSYAGGYPAIAYERESKKAISENVKVLNDGTIYLAEPGITAGEFISQNAPDASVKIFTKDYSAEIASADKISNGAIMVEYLNGGKTVYYNEICMPYDTGVTVGRDIITSDDGKTVYRYYARSSFAHFGEEKTYKLILASYKDGGEILEDVNVKDVVLSDTYSRDFTESSYIEYESQAANRIFKGFLWEENKPLVPCREYPGKYKIDTETEEILVMSVGNSYSQDSITYLKEIAAADGVKLGAYNCYVGGRELSAHYDAWTNDTWEYEMRNGSGWLMNTSPKNMVSGYDWDYVILQGATHPQADDEILWGESDNYADVIKTFADDVAELAPQAERLFVAPWAPSEEISLTAYNGKFSGSENARADITSALLERQSIAAGIYSTNGSDAYLPTAVAVDYLIRYYGFPEFVLDEDGVLYDNSETSRGIYRDTTCHLTDSVGRVLAGLVWYEMITGNCAIDNAYTNALSEDDMAKIKAAAHFACENYKTYDPSAITPLAD